MSCCLCSHREWVALGITSVVWGSRVGAPCIWSSQDLKKGEKQGLYTFTYHRLVFLFCHLRRELYCVWGTGRVDWVWSRDRWDVLYFLEHSWKHEAVSQPFSLCSPICNKTSRLERLDVERWTTTSSPNASWSASRNRTRKETNRYSTCVNPTLLCNSVAGVPCYSHAVALSNGKL